MPDVRGHVDVQNGAFQQFKYQSLTADGIFANDRIGIDARLVQGPGVELTAKGTLPLSALKPNPPGTPEHVEGASDTIDLTVQSSKIDLGIVQGFTTLLTDVTGTMQADVRVTGSGRDPHKLLAAVPLEAAAIILNAHHQLRLCRRDRHTQPPGLRVVGQF